MISWGHPRIGLWVALLSLTDGEGGSRGRTNMHKANLWVSTDRMWIQGLFLPVFLHWPDATTPTYWQKTGCRTFLGEEADLPFTIGLYCSLVVMFIFAYFLALVRAWTPVLGPRRSFLGSLYPFKLSQLPCCLKWSSKSSMLNSSLNRAHFIVSSEVKITFNLHPKIITWFILPAHVRFIYRSRYGAFPCNLLFHSRILWVFSFVNNIDPSHFLMVSW